MEGLGGLLVLGAAVLLGEHPLWLSSGRGGEDDTRRQCPRGGVMPSCPSAWAPRWSWAVVGVLALGGGCSLPVPMPGAQGTLCAWHMGGSYGFPPQPGAYGGALGCPQAGCTPERCAGGLWVSQRAGGGVGTTGLGTPGLCPAQAGGTPPQPCHQHGVRRVCPPLPQDTEPQGPGSTGASAGASPCHGEGGQQQRKGLCGLVLVFFQE